MRFHFHHILWLLLFGALAVQCSDKNDSSDGPSGKYTSFWYYSYAATDQLTAETMGLEAGKFTPYTIAQRGDTLFIANTADKSLILFDLKTHKPFRTLSSWTIKGGATKKFSNNIEAIVFTDERVYVEDRGSYIHVFDLPDLNYVTHLGNGQYWNAVFEPQALAVKDGLIYARDKNGMVSIYQESAATPAKAGNVGRYRRAAGGSSNNGFAPHYMEFDSDGTIMLTDYETKAIRVLDPSLINDNFKNGESIDIADRAWQLTFKPRTFASTEARLYATGDNNSINVYDREAKGWVNSFKAIKSFSFSQPTRVFASGNETLWVSDGAKQTAVQMTVSKNEIRQYSRVNDRIIRVEEALTSKGTIETEPFYVDIRTHEIVDPATIAE